MTKYKGYIILRPNSVSVSDLLSCPKEYMGFNWVCDALASLNLRLKPLKPDLKVGRWCTTDDLSEEVKINFMLKELQTIGLGKNEALTYEALVKNGPCRAGVIIAKSDMHRNLVYQSLEKLVLKGYATKFIKKGVWHFQITDPNSLLTALRQKENIFREVIESIKTCAHKTDQQIVVYEGIESYRSYWVESLRRIPENSIDHTVGAPTNSKWSKIMGNSYKDYMRLRVTKKIKWQTIHFKITQSEKEMLQRYPHLTEYRLWPRNIECVGNFNVIHDTVILHAITEPPRIIEIRDKTVVMIFKNYFDMMWEKSTPVIV